MGDFCCQALVLFILSFPFVTLAGSLVQQTPLCHDNEKSALLELKQSFSVLCHYGYPKMEYWAKGSGDCCVWDGVECNQDTGRVTALDLSKSCLHGNFPSNSPLFTFSSLQTLNLASNNFIYSKIPLAISQLDKLKTLNLSNSSFTGQIPSQISKLSSLSTLDLSANYGLFSNLNTFSMLENLTYLDLSGVNLMPPSEISRINSSSPRLKILSLESCNLTMFPDFLQGQNELEYLSLSWNNIQGNIPQWFVDTAEKSLLFLDLSYNNLAGFEQPLLDIPWKFLEYLDLSGNRLHGPLPNPSKSLLAYKASNNQFAGFIPESICNASSLKVLDLSNNTMSGPIPECLGNQLAQSLQVLNLKDNNLSGRVPPTSNKTCTLKMIHLGGNQLEGNLPRWLANCKMLEVLDIESNSINDTFPSWLASLNKLQALVLRQNNFHGVITSPTNSSHVFPMLHIIDLSSNFFSGDLPSRHFQHWEKMKEPVYRLVYSAESTIVKPISGEPYVGSEEYTIPRFINYINLSSNKFSGRIPETIGTLSGLAAIILSNNNLQGGIPSSIGKLVELELLDLSQNMLSGRIPPELSLLNFLEVFNVSHNNLVGPIPNGTQLQWFDSSTYKGDIGLCGPPLTNKCAIAEKAKAVSPSPAQLLDSDEHNNTSELVEWMIRLAGYVSGFVIGFFIGKVYITDRNHAWFVDTFGNTKLKRRPRKSRR